LRKIKRTTNTNGSLSRTRVSEKYDSDFDESSHGDDKQIKDSINEYDEEH